MTLSEFIKKYNGKTVDWDQAYGGQCVDLYRQYCHEVLDFPQSPPVSGASKIWDTYLKDYFDKVPNTPSGVPEHGDIMIWSDKTGGGYGHVGIFVEGTVGSFRSFDQNWPTGSPCAVVGHYYTNVLGWLHPKNNNGADYYKGIDLNNKDSVKVCVDTWKEVADGNYVKREEYIKLQNEYKANDDAWKERVANEKKQYTDFLKTLAEKLDSTQDEPAIIEQITRLVQVEDRVGSELEPKIRNLEERISGIARLVNAEEKEIEKRIKEILKNDTTALEEEIEGLREALRASDSKRLKELSLLRILFIKYGRG